MKRILLYTVVCVAMMLPCGVMAANEDFARLMQQFEKAPKASEANRFFALLQNEEFTDSLISFAASTPADTLKAQVWYWEAEKYLLKGLAATEEAGNPTRRVPKPICKKTP